jgi:1A family penicillin-binding protein
MHNAEPRETSSVGTSMDDTSLSTARAARQLAAAISSDLTNISPRLGFSARRVGKWLWWAIAASIFVASATAVTMLWALYPLALDDRPGLSGASVLVEAANGESLGRVGPMSVAVRRDEFPQPLVQAVLSIEDRRFYSHWGIDPWGIARATHANWSAGTIVEGGSTITQQLVKTQLVGNERSFGRKLRESFMAIWLDLRLGKDEILTRYLNSVYLGAGAYGMPAAARIYFDKSLSELTLSESAMLAGLIQAPSRYDPIRNLDAAQRRAAVVLDAMVEAGAIDGERASAAKAKPATVNVSPRVARANSWFADWIAKSEVPKLAGSAKRTVRVRTTLEPEVQRVGERIVKEALNRTGDARGASEAALIALRPDGSVVAMVGGRNYDESQFNRAADAQRQPGSTFKVFVYYAALRNGYLPDSTVDASPLEIGRWRPRNYGNQHRGRMGLSQAFAQSVNTAAARLAMTVGLKQVIAAARELGLEAPLKEVPSMALGSNEVTLLDLTGAFASIRAGRSRLRPWGISAFASDAGALRQLGAPEAEAGELPHKEQLTRLLRGVVERGTGQAAAIDGVSVAGKTGTSQDHRDAWFVGFTDDLIVGVWVGNDDRSPTKGLTGGTLPAQIWRSFVVAATPLLAPKKPETAELSPPQAVAAQPQCDQSACAARYSSFRASDCTYQSYSGSRKLCTIQDSSATPTAKDGEQPSKRPEGKRDMASGDQGESRMSLGSPRDPAMALHYQVRRRTAVPLPSEPAMPAPGSSGLFRPFDRRGSY